MYDTTYPVEKKREVKIVGRWFMKLYGPNGDLKDEASGKNVITNSGLAFVTSFLNSAAAAASTFTMGYIAMGTDATAEMNTDAALGTELSRHTGTVSVSGTIYIVKATFAAGSGTGAIAEYGLFSSNTGGTMLSRDTEAVINKGAGDSLEVTTEITMG